MDYTFNYTLRLLQHLLLQPPPREARALAPTAAALRRRRRMLPALPWPEAGAEAEATPDEGRRSTGHVKGATSARPARQRLLHPPWWGLELHLGVCCSLDLGPGMQTRAPVLVESLGFMAVWTWDQGCRQEHLFRWEASCHAC
jgi:hypothetical protein